MAIIKNAQWGSACEISFRNTTCYDKHADTDRLQKKEELEKNESFVTIFQYKKEQVFNLLLNSYNVEEISKMIALHIFAKKIYYNLLSSIILVY